MIGYILAAVAVFILILVLVSAPKHGSTPDDLFDRPAKPAPPSAPPSRTKYQDQNLHRNDARHARHKQNQWPL